MEIESYVKSFASIQSSFLEKLKQSEADEIKKHIADVIYSSADTMDIAVALASPAGIPYMEYWGGYYKLPKRY